MSEERQEDVADALENAVAAVESEPPGHALAAYHKSNRAKSWAAVLTALAALIAAVGAFMKTLDHGVSKNVYETLSDSIVKLSDQQRRTQEDVAMLRGYLDGLAHAPLASAAPPVVVDAGAPHPPTVATSTSTITFNIVDAGPPSHVRPPAVAPPAPPVKPPSFAAAISK